MTQLEYIFRFVLVVSIYGTFLGLTLLLLKTLLKNRLSPKWHYALWFVLVLKLILPFGPATTFSVANLLKVDNRISVIETAIRPEAAAHSLKRNPSEAGKFLNYGGLANNIEAFNQKIKEKEKKVVASSPSIISLVTILWLIGSGILSLWFLRASITFRKRLKKGECDVPDEIEILLKNMKMKMGIKKSIALQCCKGSVAPATYGILRQKIVLGEENLVLDRKTLSYVMLHELAHIKRRDSLMNLMLILLSIVHWFNPILWICFVKMRQDMEQATDQLVLSTMENEQHKAYGLALLEVLTNLNQRPRSIGYLGLVDNKKFLEERIKRIKMNKVFNRKKKSMLAIGVVCMLALSGVFLTNGVEKLNVEAESINAGPLKMPYASYNAESLYKYRSTKPSEKAKIKELLKALPTGTTGKTGFYVDKKIFGLSYEFNKTLILLDNDSEHHGLKNTMRKNGAILFTLIPNLEYINIDGFGEKALKLTRTELQKEYKMEFSKIGLSKETFGEFLRYLSLDVKTYPEAYTPAMSSVPGIGITPSYSGSVDRVVYTATYGQLLEWDSSGKITELGRKTEKDNTGNTIFWSPLNQLATSYVPSSQEVKVEIYKAGKKLTEKVLRFDDSATGMYKLIEIKNDKFQDLY